MDIGSILNEVGGASAIARQLGVDESTVESGTGALLPHVVRGVQAQGLPSGVAKDQTDAASSDAQSGDPNRGSAAGGLGGMLGGLMAGGGEGILGSLVGAGLGDQILGHIFGSKDTSRDVASQASEQSGVDSSILKKLLPIVAGAVAMHYSGRRGQGGPATASEQGGGGILGSILGSLGGQ